MTDEEYKNFGENDIDEDSLNEILDALSDGIDDLVLKDGDVTMLNPDGMKKFYAVYNTVKSTVGKGAKVTYVINDPFVGHGAIRIEGKKISFKNTKLLMEAAKLASNFEVYPLANGKVRMAFAFSKLTLR